MARAVQAVFIVAAIFAVVGLYTRVAASIATLAVLYLLAIPQLYGTVRHYHHLVWFAAICAAAPSGDALSSDAVWRARRGEACASSAVHRRALHIVWFLIGCIFFFPGLWKWRVSGLAWAFSDNLVNQMRWKWLQHRWVPGWRIDLHPRLCHLAALSTMIFEIGFVLCLPFRCARRIAVLSALAFHLATWALMRIGFASLAWCYLAFLPIGAWSGAGYTRALRALAPTRATRPPARGKGLFVVAAWLVAGVLHAGILGRVAGWPFARYPTFAAIVPDVMPDLEVELLNAERRASPLDRRVQGIDPQRLQGLAWALLAAPTATKLADYLSALEGARPELRSAQRAIAYRVLREVDPARWAAPPQDRRLLLALRRGGDGVFVAELPDRGIAKPATTVRRTDEALRHPRRIPAPLLLGHHLSE